MNLLNSNQVAAKLGMTKGAFYQLKHREVSFPKPINVHQKTLRWDEQDVNTWLEQKKESAYGEGVGA